MNKVLIGGAWPYANGSLHIGHIAGLLPGDVLARYHRAIGDDVYYCVVEHDSISSFPIRISATAGPKEQAPIGYYLTVTANHSYETVDATGNSKVVNQGEYIYSQYFDISEDLQVDCPLGI